MTFQMLIDEERMEMKKSASMLNNLNIAKDVAVKQLIKNYLLSPKEVTAIVNVN